MPRIAFLGPRGTFTEEALLSERDLGAAEHVPKGSIPEVIAAVGGGEVDAAVVPLENAIEGSIDLTVDALVFGADVLIRRELIRPISLNLVAKPATRLRDVRAVVSIPAATGQCREWLERRLPGVELLAANSTAGAIEQVARSRKPGLAAIGNRLAADLYGLSVVAAEIEDHPENVTRFAVLGHGVPAPTGHDKTTIVCFQRADRPARCSRSCRSSRLARSTSRTSTPARRRRGSAATASSSTSRGTSRTSSSPTRSASSPPSTGE